MKHGADLILQPLATNKDHHLCQVWESLNVLMSTCVRVHVNSRGILISPDKSSCQPTLHVEMEMSYGQNMSVLIGYIYLEERDTNTTLLMMCTSISLSLSLSSCALVSL